MKFFPSVERSKKKHLPLFKKKIQTLNALWENDDWDVVPTGGFPGHGMSVKYAMGKIHPDDSKQIFLQEPLCDYACGVLHKEHPFRKKVYKVVRSKTFDIIVIIFILLNSLTMAMTDYRVGCLRRNEEAIDFGLPDRKRCFLNAFVTFMNDYVFGVAFLLEMVLKIIAMGFACEGENTYMSDKWNVLDFVCVLAWIVGQMNVPGMPNFTYFRNFRLLRPLKSLSKFPGLRAIVSTFLAALPRLKDVVILLLFLLLVCSIACMQFFKGYLHYRCRITRFPTQVPDTWYRSCGIQEENGTRLSNCVYNKYIPTEDEVLAYKNITLSWDFLDADQWTAYRNSAFYQEILTQYGWTDPVDWACNSPQFNEASGYPHGIPVTAEYPGRSFKDYRGKDGVKSSKIWGKPKRCMWLVDEDDTRPCSLPGNGGLHTCYGKLKQQRGRYHDASSYEDKSNPQQIISLQFTETTCGSNYDEFGNRRFKMAPVLHKDLNPRRTVPGELTDWSRYSPTFFRSMYPEFIPELNFGYTNFDSIGYAMVTLFQAVTMEGWTDIMYLCMDVFSPTAAVTLFVLLFAVGSMLVLNLVLGVIADTLGDEEAAQEREEKAQREREVLALRRGSLSLDSTPSSGGGKPPGAIARPMKPLVETESEAFDRMAYERRDRYEREDLKMRLFLLDVVESSLFSYIIYGCILANTVALCLDDYPRASEWTQAMELVNVGLTFVFIIEMFVKLGALGISGYLEDQFNIFDGCIVVVSIVDLVLAAANVSFGGGAVFSALRCFRVFRIFKLAKSWSSLQVLLATIYETTQEIGNFLVLLLLFAFIFALAGQQLFANQLRFDDEFETGAKVKFGTRFPLDDDQVGRRKSYLYAHGRGRKKVHYAFKRSAPVDLNFDDFGMAFITVFGILTGESWNLIMYDMIRGTNLAIGCTYMGLTIIILSFCLMNMFLAILLSKFENNEELSGPPQTPGGGAASLHRIASAAVLASLRTGKQPPKLQSAAVFPTDDSDDEISGPSQQQKRFDDDDGDGTSNGLSGLLMDDTEKEEKVPEKSPTTEEEEGKPPGRRPSRGGSAPVLLSRMSQGYSIQDLALGLFPPEHYARKFCVKVVRDPRFDKFIMACILLSSMFLAMQSPLMNPKSNLMVTLRVFDYIFTGIFIIECALKIVALGFVANGKGSYLREPWNVLDFTIVCISVATLFQFESLKAFKVLRVFRVFRPLRMLSRSPGLRLVLNSLIIAIPSAINVMVVCILYMFIFAIMGEGFFKGQMKLCDFDTYPLPDAALESLVEKPITLRTAIRNGAFEELYNATNGASTCWLTWDKDFINKKDYFNYDTEIASEFSVGVEKARRERNMFFLSSRFSHDIEKPNTGVGPDTAAFFASHPKFLENLSDEDRYRALDPTGNLDNYMPTSKDMCRCLFKEEAAWTDALYLNFDSVTNAFLLLFEIYSTEGWCVSFLLLFDLLSPQVGLHVCECGSEWDRDAADKGPQLPTPPANDTALLFIFLPRSFSSRRWIFHHAALRRGDHGGVHEIENASGRRGTVGDINDGVTGAVGQDA